MATAMTKPVCFTAQLPVDKLLIDAATDAAKMFHP
jgi:hypothetical protein